MKRGLVCVTAAFMGALLFAPAAYALDDGELSQSMSVTDKASEIKNEPKPADEPKGDEQLESEDKPETSEVPDADHGDGTGSEDGNCSDGNEAGGDAFQPDGDVEAEVPDEDVVVDSVTNPDVVEDDPEPVESVPLSNNASTSSKVPDKVEDGAYIIDSELGTSLDVAGASTANSANVQTYGPNYSAAQRFYIAATGQASNGEWYYTIKNVNSGKVLDCAWGGKTSGTNIQQFASNGSSAQQWYLRKIVFGGHESYQIVSLLSGLSLDVCGGSKAYGANLQLWQVNGTAAQAFALKKCVAVVEDGAYVIVSTLPGKRVVDVYGASPDNGAAVQTYAPNGTLAQAFALTYEKSSGYYTMTNYASGRVVDVTAGSTNQGALLQQYASNGTKAQKWQILKNANGSYTFVSAIDGKAFDISGGRDANGARLQQYVRNNTAAQKFTLMKASPVISGGIVSLRNGANTYVVADVKNGSTSAGGTLQIYNPNGTFAQKFQIVQQSDGFWTIRSIVSGLYVSISKTGAVSQEKADNSTRDHLWKVQTTNTGHFLFTSVHGFVLGVPGKVVEGTDLANDSSAKLASTWNPLYVTLVDDGLYTLASLKNTGLVVDVNSASLNQCANVQLWGSNGTNAQKFYIRNAGNGQYTIVNAWSLQALDVKNGGAYAGSNVWQYGINNSQAQKWQIVWDEAGGFVFKSALGSFSLGTADAVSNGSNVYLRAYDAANANQRFRLAPTAFKPLTYAERIAVLDNITGRGLNTFGSIKSVSASAMNQLYSAIASYENRGKNVAFVLIDLTTGAGVSYGADNKYYSASTIKGPYVAALNEYYPWLLNSWRNPMYGAIDVSSNEDYAYLRNSLGDQALINLINETHAWDFDWRSHYVNYSARDLAKLWVGMGQYFMSNNANAAWCRSVFGSNDYITSRPTLSWKNCPIYAKSGWVDGGITVHNEGCLVASGSNPYVMVVMSTMSSSNSWYMSNLMRALDRVHSELV